MKKLLTLILAIVMVSALAISASAFTLTEDDNIAEIAIDEDGDYDGVFILSLADGLSLARDPQSPGGALVVYNPENGKLVVAGIGLLADDVLVKLTFEGEGTWTLVGEPGGAFADVEPIVGEVGDDTSDTTCPDCGNDPCTCPPDVVNPPEVTDPTEPGEIDVEDIDSVDQLKSMSLADLMQLAAQLGIDTAGMSQAQLISAIADALDLTVKGGVALAIVPALVAGAAVVVARKRK